MFTDCSMTEPEVYEVPQRWRSESEINSEQPRVVYTQDHEGDNDDDDDDEEMVEEMIEQEVNEVVMVAAGAERPLRIIDSSTPIQNELKSKLMEKRLVVYIIVSRKNQIIIRIISKLSWTIYVILQRSTFVCTILGQLIREKF